MKKPDNAVIIIFGASGDLSKRKLLPALYRNFLAGSLPERFAVLGASRTVLTDGEFQNRVIESTGSANKKKTSDISATDNSTPELFARNCFYQTMNPDSAESFLQLSRRLEKICAECGLQANFLFYIALPPSQYMNIVENLAAAGLNNQRSGSRKIIIEKPFGRDLASARKLNSFVLSRFGEDQVYRIDHYLGKETVQNILALRFSNSIFEPLWNRHCIDHIEITGAESIGVGKRGGYYDSSGALRDMIQSHLMQVLAVVTMESPPHFNPSAVRTETAKVFNSLKPIPSDMVTAYSVRGQYRSAHVRGEEQAGYLEEEGIRPDSKTETYAAIKVCIENWRWSGVPVYIRTGKRLPVNVTEVVINFKKTPYHLFRDTLEGDIPSNQLIIRIQPDEGILLQFGLKTPGSGFRVHPAVMDFHYSQICSDCIPDAYERLLIDCLSGDNTLYARADAVEACWSFIDPVLSAWENDKAIPMYSYACGTWGPEQSSSLFLHPKTSWRFPCRNLGGDTCVL